MLRLVRAAQTRHAETGPPSEAELRRAAVAGLLAAPEKAVSAEEVIPRRAAVEAYRVRSEIIAAAVTEAEADLQDAIHENIGGIVRALAAGARRCGRRSPPP